MKYIAYITFINVSDLFISTFFPANTVHLRLDYINVHGFGLPRKLTRKLKGFMSRFMDVIAISETRFSTHVL